MREEQTPNDRHTCSARSPTVHGPGEVTEGKGSARASGHCPGAGAEDLPGKVADGVLDGVPAWHCPSLHWTRWDRGPGPVSDACRPLAIGSVAEPKSHPLRRSGVGGYCWASVWLITLKGTHGDPPEPPLSVKAVVTSPSLSVTAAPRVHRCLQSSVKCPGGMGPPMQRRTLSPECKVVSPAATHVTPNTSPSDSGAA